MSKLYFVNHKSGRKYEVLKLDKDKGRVTLKGDFGEGFEEPYDRERFERMGYVLEQGTE